MMYQGSTACFGRSRNLSRGMEGQILTLYPVLQFGKASIGPSHKRSGKWVKGEMKC